MALGHLGLLDVAAGAVDVAGVRVGDGGRDGEHDVAERAAVGLPERRLRALDHRHALDAGPAAADHGPVDPLQQVHADRPTTAPAAAPAAAAAAPPPGRPAPAGPRPAAAGSAPRRPGRPRRGAGRPPPAAPARRVSRSPLSSAASPIRAVAKATPRSAPWCSARRRRPLGEVDHLVVRDRAVEQVLRHAQVGVEHRGRQPRVVLRTTQLAQEALEPLAPLVGDQALQPDEVHDLPGVARLEQRARRVRGLPRRVEVAGEVGQAAAGQQQRSVRGVPLDVEVRERRLRGLEVALEGRRPAPAAPAPAGARSRWSPTGPPGRRRRPTGPPGPSAGRRAARAGARGRCPRRGRRRRRAGPSPSR